MKRRSFLEAACHAAGLVLAIASSANACDAQETAIAQRHKSAMQVAAPEGFEVLLAPQEVVVDVFMNDSRVGEALAVVQGGHFRFVDPRKLVDSLPEINDRPRVLAALAVSDLDTHGEAVCRPGADAACARPTPDVAAIVYDGARYRVDIVINPRYLTVRAAVRMQNLPQPSSAPGVVNFLSATASGGGSLPVQYFVQNNAVLGIGTGRIRANIQQASYSGFQTDTFVGELDRPGLRFRAGAFWVPGDMLIDRIKVLGGGISTQFDTRLDRDQLMGSPLIIFLEQRSRVDILVNGNIMSSQAYDAGNQALDTAGLPSGSYTLILRITTAAGQVREERRFFSRNPAMAVQGHDAYFLYAGAFVRDSEGIVGDVTHTPLFQAGWARRLRPTLSINLGLIGTDRRQWVSAGATMLTSSWQFNASVHASSRGGLGLYGHVSRTDQGPLSVDLDARHVSNPGGGPLLAATTFVLPVPGGLQYTQDVGAYSQVSGAMGYRLGSARLTMAGSYRRQEGRRRDYSIGPGLYLPLVRRGAMTLDLNASYAFTSLGRQGYAGVALNITRPRTTYTAVAGGQAASGGRLQGNGLYGGFRMSRRFDDVLDTQVQVDGGVQHANGISYADAQANAHGAIGDASVNLIQPLDRDKLQFGASMHTALVADGSGVRLSQAGNGEAMLIVGVDAEQRGAAFEIVIDNRVAGTVRAGDKVTIALPSYRAYAVRIRSKGGTLSAYDANVRQVSLYPGNVARMNWRVTPVAAVFGRLVRVDGKPLGHADITAGSDLAQSDEQGRFLIQTGSGATLTVHARDGMACSVALPPLAPVEGYSAIGDQVCHILVPSSFASTNPAQTASKGST